jgi:hypothetical protein
LAAGPSEPQQPPARRKPGHRGLEREATDGLEDELEGSIGRLDVGDDLGGAEGQEALAALGRRGDGGRERALCRGQLDQEVPDAAGGAGEQDALSDQRTAEAQQPQRGESGDPERRGDGSGDVVGQRGDRVGRRRHPRGPAARGDVRDDPRTFCRPAAVGRRTLHAPGHVLAWPPVSARRLEQEGLTAVDRVGLDGHERLAGRGVGLRNVGEGGPAGCVGRGDEGGHAHRQQPR